ncbi:MAG: phosphatase PAP2 family protein [Flavobacteriales bacterium]|nr:phosphatase PAP2 family protein [Flavobacteriales bacterium]
MLETLESLDQALFLYLNGLHNDFLDLTMLWISNKFIWIPFYLGLLVLIVRKHEWRSLIIIIPILILLITLSDQISVQIFKNGFERLRPCHNEDLKNLVHLVGNCGGKFGFISSHACNTFALSAFIIYVMKSKSLVYIMIVWAVVVSYSRIYLGVHYPADVLIGALIGWLIGYVVWNITKSANSRLDYILSYD